MNHPSIRFKTVFTKIKMGPQLKLLVWKSKRIQEVFIVTVIFFFVHGKWPNTHFVPLTIWKDYSTINFIFICMSK